MGTVVTRSIGWIFRNEDGRHDTDMTKSLECEKINFEIEKKHRHVRHSSINFN